MEKNSFTFFETILSILILSIIVSSFSQLLLTNNSYDKYNELQCAQNNFNSKNYTEDFSISNMGYDFTDQQNATVIFNSTGSNQRISYNSININLSTYDLQFTSNTNIPYKDFN